MVRAKSNGEEIGLTGWSEAMQLDSSSRSTVAIAGRGSEKAETERSCSDVATGPGTGAREDESESSRTNRLNSSTIKLNVAVQQSTIQY